MRLRLIGCSMILRELSEAVPRSPHAIDIEYLPAGLHDTGAHAMRSRIQQAIDNETGNHDYILIGYGLCGNGTLNLTARNIPLLLPRAHDCITLLIGGRSSFRRYSCTHPGTYFGSAGWTERGAEIHNQLSVGVNTPLESWVLRYGEESGRYLYEQFNRYRTSYSRLTFIRNGLEADSAMTELARADAAANGWSYEEIAGSLEIFRRLLAGDWQDDFVIVPPGCRAIATYDEEIFSVAPVTAINKEVV